MALVLLLRCFVTFCRSFLTSTKLFAPATRTQALTLCLFTSAFQIYESFLGPYDYLLCCGILSLPNLLSPLFLASHTPHPTASYASKATVYLAVYSFIGNYFYTHYFYAVLKAEYTFPGVRLNDVPIGESEKEREKCACVCVCLCVCVCVCVCVRV